MNDRFPYDVKEFLYSGLPYAWPADPETGKPMKLVDKVEPKPEDWGKIAYVRNSDVEAYFEIALYDVRNQQYDIIKIPHPLSAEITIKEINNRFKTSPISIPEDSFHSILNGLFGGSLGKHEYRKEGKVPAGIEDALQANYFWIKENMAPDFISADPEATIFYECGLAYLDGTPVEFFHATLPLISRNGNLIHANYRDITKLTSLDTVGNPKEDLDRLTNITYFYSTKMVLEGTLNLPESVMISRDEILNLE